MPHTPDGSDEGAEGDAHIFAPDLHDARHLWLKTGLLTVWALASFVVFYFARHLMFTVGGWPVGFWMASQGAVFVFFCIVVVYASAMSWFERQDLPRASESSKLNKPNVGPPPTRGRETPSCIPPEAERLG